MFVEEKFEIKWLSNKLFGKVLSIILIGLGIFFYFIHNNNIGILFFLISFLALLTSIFSPNLLKPLNSFFVFFGSKINHLITFLIICILFVFVFSLLGLIIRLFKKDMINQNINNHEKTYWIKRETTLQSMDKQF